MLTIVLSGGANFGAMQVGALQVLLEEGFQPMLAVGTSAGSLNAIYFASDPTPEGMQKLAEHWREVGLIKMGLPTLLNGVRRWVTHKPGLISNQPLADFLRNTLPRDANTFGELAKMHSIQAYAVAVCMETTETVAFGDQQDDLLIDGAMASTAIPPFFPPWRVGDKRYLDGGVTSKLPLCMAIDRGATQIIALDVEEAMGSLEAATDVASIGGYSLSLMVEYQTRIEIERARARGVALRVFSLRPPPDLEIWDYTAAERLIELGRQQTLASLRAQPLVKASAAQIWIRRMMVNLLDRLAGNRKFGAEVNDSGRRD